MRKTAYITLSASVILFVTFLVVWLAGFFFASASLGSLIHLILLATIFPIVGFIVGIILLIISFTKK